MITQKFVVSIMTGSMLLAGPVASFAAGSITKAAPARTLPSSDVTEEDILNIIEESPPLTPPIPLPADGRGGGIVSVMPPYYGGNGVQVDASITKEVTPDFLALNAYCDSGKMPNRQQAKDALDQIFNDIKNTVGKDGRVRKAGPVSIFPFYNPSGEDSGSFTSNLSIFIRITNPSVALRISDSVEEKGCTANWDVRLVDAQDFELSVLDQLSTRLNKRKAVFEKLLGKKLNTINSASLYTWLDGYTSYDPETNKAEATTTLSVSFDLGGKTTIPTTRSSSTRRTTVPRG